MLARKLFFSVLLVVFSFSAPAFAEEITIVGTGSGASVLEAVTAAFTTSNPEVSIRIPASIGSGGGIKAVGTDQAVIARVAREIRDKEKPYGLTYIPFARLPIVFFVNANVGIESLSPQKICDIYSGKVTNWKDVGGHDEEIRVVRREDGDSSLEVLQSLLSGFKDITITSKSKTTLSDPSTCELIQEKQSSIAFGTYANAKEYRVKILKIDGRSPMDTDYPYMGTLALVFKEQNKTGSIAKLLEFTASEGARDIIRSAGGLPF